MYYIFLKIQSNAWLGWREEKFFWHKRMLVIVHRRNDKIGKSPFCKQCKNWFKQALPNDAKKNRVQGFPHSQSFTHKLFIDYEEK